MIRTTMLRLALLGGAAAVSLPLAAWAQTSPANPDRTRPPAATEGSTRPGMAQPAPTAQGGATSPSSTTAQGGPRNDSVRPEAPNQGVAAGQGSAVTTTPRADTATTTTGRDSATGATSPNPRTTEGGQNAVQVDEGTRLGNLEPGANSFTEGQARSRIEAAGFTNINDLKKDDNGIWRGRAMRGGQQVDVGLDYRGNVAPMQR